MRISTFIMSCTQRQVALRQTLTSLAASGWRGEPEVILDQGLGDSTLGRIWDTWKRMIARAAQAETPYVLLLEDDVIFGRWFPQNLDSWGLPRGLPPGTAFYASLYNPGLPYITRNESENYLVADPRWVWGSQALLLSTSTARFIERNWNTVELNPDMRMPRLVRPITPVYYHVPSLVDHAPAPTTWGGIVHSAIDFDPEWRSSRDGSAPAPPCIRSSDSACSTSPTTEFQSPGPC